MSRSSMVGSGNPGAAIADNGAQLERQFLDMVDSARDPIWILHDRTVIHENAAARVRSKTHDQDAGTFPPIHPEDQKELLHAVGKGAKGAVVINMRVRTNNTRAGEVEHWLLQASTIIFNGREATMLRSVDHAPATTSLEQEQVRARMAEDVNKVLRQEIGEHRRTQEALGKSKRFARALVESSLDMIMAADPDGIVTEYNPAASLKFGYEPEEVIGTDTRRLYASEDEYKRVQTELNTHGAFTGEVRNVTRDGEVFTCFLAASRLYDDEGRFLGAMGVSRDITRIKRDQEAMAASEERYRDLFENATDLIQSVDTEGRIQYVNNAWKSTLGYSDAEIAQLSLFELVRPDEREHCMDTFKRLLDGEHTGPIETVFVSKDGRAVRVVGSSNVRVIDGKAVATRSIFRDITGVHEVQERAQQQAAKLKAIFESSEHMFWTVDRRIALTSFNKGYADMIERLYRKKPEINSDPSVPRKKFASAEYHAFWEEKYREAFAGKPNRFETDLRDASGLRVCNEIFLSPVFGPDGDVEEVFGIGHEVTEQKDAEDLVRDQGARLQAIFDSAANMMIWTLDRDFRLTSFNEHFRSSVKDAFGTEHSLGEPFIDDMARRVAGGKPERFISKYQNALKGYPQQFEVELVGADGRNVWVENFLNPIMTEGRVTEISCLAHTITDKKEAQVKLLDSLREKEVLLKEVHHRVKNNLQVISSILNLQSDHVDGDPRIIALLRDSQARIRSMSFIHESLYQRKNFNSVDIGAYIESLSRNLLMSYSLAGKIQLNTEVESVELSLDQAIPCGLLLNELISNALKHAFPNDAEGHIAISVKRTVDGVGITISDDGIGLPEGFDLARDANLGLQLVTTLIGQVDGSLRLDRDKGTAYTITFAIAPVRVPV